MNSLRVGGLPPIEKLLLQPLPRPLVAPHPLLDQIVPGLVHQAAGLQVLRGKVEEAGDEEVFTSFSDGQQLAHVVNAFTIHLELLKGIIFAILQKKYNLTKTAL